MMSKECMQSSMKMMDSKGMPMMNDASKKSSVNLLIIEVRL
jgi:hypothetical protein